MNENLIPKNEKNESLKGIDNLLNNFLNEIPDELINGSEKENHIYKVRVNWFNGVFNALERAYLMKLLSEDFRKEVHVFFEEFKESHKKDSDRTTKEEIDKADDLLKRAKEIIEKI